jgi:hypothetical protein
MWPFQPKPPKPYWASFRKCLRLTICRPTPHTERPGNGMTVYRTYDRLFYREADKIRVPGKAPTSGFFHFNGMADSIR